MMMMQNINYVVKDRKCRS